MYNDICVMRIRNKYLKKKIPKSSSLLHGEDDRLWPRGDVQ